MCPALRSRRRAPLRVAISGAAIGGQDGNGRVWQGALAELPALVKTELVPRGGRPSRKPDVWLADHQPLPEADGEPIVRVVHEASWVRADFRAVLSPDELAWADAAIRFAAAGATRLLVPTRAGAAEVGELTGIPGGRCDVVAYGHDPARAAAARAERGRRIVGTDGPFVLFVGQAHPKKQLEVLRAAMPAGSTLVVVAGASHRPDGPAALAAAVAPLDGVRIVDLTTRANAERHRLEDAQLADVMAAAAVLCLPSLGEGFGLPVLEAMAVGCPVVVSDRGALPELVGAAATPVAPTAGAIAAALEPLLSDPEARAAASRAARERARPLTWEATAFGWRESLQRAAEEGAPAAEHGAPAGATDRWSTRNPRGATGGSLSEALR